MTPSPGDYTPEKGERAVRSKSPAFSFGEKGKEHKQEYLPGKIFSKKNCVLKNFVLRCSFLYVSFKGEDTLSIALNFWTHNNFYP